MPIINKPILLFLLSILYCTTLSAQRETWIFDQSHCNIQFTVAHMGISKTVGTFNEFGGEISCGADFSDILISFYINSSSINTNNSVRDNHLKSPDFLAPTRYPYIYFKGTALEMVSEGHYQLKGFLKIKNIEKPIEFDVTFGGIVIDKSQSERAGFELRGVINRFDYNLTWNEMLDGNIPIVGKEVVIVCQIQIVKTK